MADTTRRPSSPPRPHVGLDTHIVMDHAVVDLADRRFIRTLDPPAQLHLLASLAAQADAWLEEQIGAARQTGTSWTAIGRLLGVTATQARQRYSPRRARAGGHLTDQNARHRTEPPMS